MSDPATTSGGLGTSGSLGTSGGLGTSGSLGTPGVRGAPETLATPEARLAWHHSLAIGLSALVLSRLCVLAGAGVRASQKVVDANRAGLPHPGSGAGLITEVFTSWDGLWYLEIVRNGYPRTVPPNVTYFQSEARAAFFPAFPAVVRAADRVLPGGDTLTALFVNTVLAVLAVVLVGELARRLYGHEVATKAMMLFAFFPGSFVLTFAYSEALMIVLAAACLLCLQDRRWLLAGLTAAAATATRPNAVALCAACAVAAFFAIRDRREWKSLAAPLLSPIGFIAFQVFLTHHTGESGVWFRVQQEAWKEGTSFGTTAVKNTLSFLGSPLSSPTDALTAVSIAAMFGALWCLWRRRLPAPMVVYIAVVLILMLLPATVTARPRFLFTAFPLVIPIAAWWPARDRFGWDLLMVACGAGLATLTSLYGVYGAIP